MQKQKWHSAFSLKNRKYILVTGADGFIGSALCRKLLLEGKLVKGAVRSQKKLSILSNKVVAVQTGEIGKDTPWGTVLNNVDTVVHLAGIAHRTNKLTKNELSQYDRVNVIGTERLVKACVQIGVRRFIFISSIGVNGEFTGKKSFTEDDIPCPAGAYAVSKWKTEQVLHETAKNTNMEIVILRAPLVYGPNAPGNFKRLMYLIKIGVPLPLGNISSLRSFIYLGNLADIINTCITHPLAAGETFLVSDGQDVTTSNLIKMLACAMGKRVILFSVHLGILKTLCKIAGKAEELEKLTESLLVDSSKIRNLLGWKPPFTLEEGIRETVKNI